MNTYNNETLKPIFGDVMSITAGAGSDNIAYSSAEFDTAMYNTMLIMVSGEATLAEGETLKVTVKVTESATSGGSFTDAETLATTATIATGGSGGSTEDGVVAYTVDISQYARYQIVEVTPDLSASGTDTATLVSSIILTDGIETPETLPTEF